MNTPQANPKEWMERALKSINGPMPEDVNRDDLNDALWILKNEGLGELTMDDHDLINRVITHQAKDQGLATSPEPEPVQAKPQDVEACEEDGGK